MGSKSWQSPQVDGPLRDQAGVTLPACQLVGRRRSRVAGECEVQIQQPGELPAVGTAWVTDHLHDDQGAAGAERSRDAAYECLMALGTS